MIIDVVMEIITLFQNVYVQLVCFLTEWRFRAKGKTRMGGADIKLKSGNNLNKTRSPELCNGKPL